jgi:hypothetical protein
MPNLDRRDLLKVAAGGLVGAALSAAVPSSAEAQAVWRALRASPPLPPRDAATRAQDTLLAALADGILPRTETPGAVDVGVPAFIAFIVRERDTAAERAQFEAGLAAIDALAREREGNVFAALAPDARERMLAILDARDAVRTEPGGTFRRVKQLTLHGWFSSERVQREVLRTEIMPGRYVGDAPHG